RERVADANASLLEAPYVRVRGAALLRVLDNEAHPGAAELARIAPLAAGLGVERRAIEHHLALLTRGERLDGGVLLEQRHHSPRAAESLVAQELGARIERSAGALTDVDELTPLLGSAPLLLHRRLEARQIDGEATLACDGACQIPRECVGVVELEHGIAVDHLRAAEVPYGALEQHHAVGEGLGETLFLGAQHALRVLAAMHQLRVRLAHLLREHRHQLVEERVLNAELVAVADGAANDPPQHVAATFVG